MSRFAMGTALWVLGAAVSAHAQTATAPAEESAALPASTAQADEAASPPGFGDIVVTAQRRQERVQDVPVAITAFGGEALERRGVVTLENIAPRVPSFYFGSFGATRPQLYIRGIGTRSFDPGSESSVGVFVDDVYLGRASGSFGSLKDIERVEVLRGPQGTLYGRNTIGGAINVITKAPTREFEGQVEAGISNYSGYEVSGGVGGPITSDGKLMFRAAGWRTYRDGFMQNLTTGTRFQGIDNFGGRLKLAFEPTDRFRINLIAEYVEDGDEAAFGGFNRGSGLTLTSEANPNAVFIARPGARPIPYRGGLKAYLNRDPILDRRAETYIGRVEYDTSFATIASITAYRKLQSDDARDLEGSSLAVVDHTTSERSKQFTQEFRITSDPNGPASFGGAVEWIVGAFYYRDRSSRSDVYDLGIDSVIGFLTGSAQRDSVRARYEVDSYAAFGQATWHVTDKLDLTVGARYTRDEKRAVQIGTTSALNVPLVNTPYAVDNSAVYTSFDPRLTATYKINNDINVYATYSTGFKSGGFQYSPFSAAQANVVFRPEEIKTYEVGIKSDWLDRRLRVNVAAFHYDYANLQVLRIVDFGGGNAANLITNAASSRVNGAELELGLHPSEYFHVSVAYGFLDAKYKSYIPNATTDFSGMDLVRSPHHSINVGAEWIIPFGDDRDLTLSADYALLDTFYHEPGEGLPAYGGAVSLSREESYGLLDLRASVNVGNLRLTGYVTNALNASYRRSTLALGSTLSDFPGAPRVYGLKVGYKF